VGYVGVDEAWEDDRCPDCTPVAHIPDPIEEDGERGYFEGPCCGECDERMYLPWVGPTTVSIEGIEGWYFTDLTGWLCVTHAPEEADRA
jgi:hypothetical protein